MIVSWTKTKGGLFLLHFLTLLVPSSFAYSLSGTSHANSHTGARITNKETQQLPSRSLLFRQHPQKAPLPWSTFALKVSRYSTNEYTSTDYSPSSSPTTRSHSSRRASLTAPIRARPKVFHLATDLPLALLRVILGAAADVVLWTAHLTTLIATGAWLRQPLKVLLKVFPPWFRYFLQPFLILYYVPLFMIRTWTGPIRQRAQEIHEEVLSGWKDAIATADEVSDYWPVHVNESTGFIEKDFNELDMQQAVTESIDLSLEVQQQQQNSNTY